MAVGAALEQRASGAERTLGAAGAPPVLDQQEMRPPASRRAASPREQRVGGFGTGSPGSVQAGSPPGARACPRASPARQGRTGARSSPSSPRRRGAPSASPAPRRREPGQPLAGRSRAARRRAWPARPGCAAPSGSPARRTAAPRPGRPRRRPSRPPTPDRPLQRRERPLAVGVAGVLRQDRHHRARPPAAGAADAAAAIAVAAGSRSGRNDRLYPSRRDGHRPRHCSARPLRDSADLGHRPLQLPLHLLHAARGLRPRLRSSCRAQQLLTFEEIDPAGARLRRPRRGQAAADRRRAAPAARPRARWSRCWPRSRRHRATSR